jgi:hypothetical protein
MSNTVIDFEPMDGSFAAQCDRIKRLACDGCVTPDLGSLMLHYYALGREEASSEQCDASAYAKANFNPLHDETLSDYRAARPADLILRT